MIFSFDLEPLFQSVQCRTNEHCGWPQKASLCRGTRCKNVSCTANSHCHKGYGQETGRCIEHRCDYSAECLTTNHCVAIYDDPRVCVHFGCEKVDCLRNTDCIDQHICVKQQCVKVECDSNIDCEKGQICVDNLCVD